jgi:hypothetical protein
VTKPFSLKCLGLPLSEKQIPQAIENLESGGKSKEALETAALRPRQVRYCQNRDVRREAYAPGARTIEGLGCAAGEDEADGIRVQLR